MDPTDSTDDLRAARGTLEALNHRMGEAARRWMAGLPGRRASPENVVEEAGSPPARESELEKLRRALAQSEARHRIFAEHTPVGLWEITLDGYTLFINQAMLRMLGLEKPEALEGRTFHEFFTKETLARMEKEHAKRPRGESSTYEVEIVDASGGRRIAMLYGAPLWEEPGRVNRLLGTFLEITQIRKAEEELRSLNQSLDSLVKERTSQLQRAVNLMAGREIRMRELKKVIARLTEQLRGMGVEPAAKDPLGDPTWESRATTGQ